MERYLIFLAMLALVLGAGCGRDAAVPPANPMEIVWTPGMKTAETALDAGRYAEAAGLYTTQLAAERARPVPRNRQLSFLHSELGTAHVNAGQPGKGLEHFLEALVIDRGVLGEDHPLVAESYNNIGEVHRQRGGPDKALEYFQKALAINLRQLGGEDPRVALTYNNIGAAHFDKGELDQALGYFQKALVIDLGSGANKADVAADSNNIGEVYARKGEHDKALEFFRGALALWTEQLGPDHPTVALCYCNMAFLHEAKKDLPKARKLLEKAHAIQTRQLGPDHPQTRDTKASLDLVK